MTAGKHTLGSTGAGGRRRRRLILAAILAAGIAVGILIALSASGGDGNGGASGGEVLGVEEVRQELAGVEQAGARLGAEGAPVRIEEFGDLQCPFCAQAASAVVPLVVEKLVRPGKASLTFRTLEFIGDDSARGARAAHAAAVQNRTWELVEVLYRNQGGENDGWLSADLVAGAAAALGLDVARLEADMGSEAVANAMALDESAAREGGIQSTPTFRVSGSAGTEVLTGEDAQSIDAIEAAAERVAG